MISEAELCNTLPLTGLKQPQVQILRQFNETIKNFSDPADKLGLYKSQLGLNPSVRQVYIYIYVHIYLTYVYIWLVVSLAFFMYVYVYEHVALITLLTLLTLMLCVWLRP